MITPRTQRLGEWTDKNAELLMQCLDQHAESMREMVAKADPATAPHLVRIVAESADRWESLSRELNEYYNEED